MADAMTSKILAEARRAGLVLAGAAGHLAWYVSYHLDLGGAARVDDAARSRRRASQRRR